MSGPGRALACTGRLVALLGSAAGALQRRGRRAPLLRRAVLRGGHGRRQRPQLKVGQLGPDASLKTTQDLRVRGGGATAGLWCQGGTACSGCCERDAAQEAQADGSWLRGGVEVGGLKWMPQEIVADVQQQQLRQFK